MGINEVINKAIGPHLRWTFRIGQAIKSGSSEFKPAIVKADNNCEFGKWLYNDAPAEFKTLPIYREIKTIHAQFHIEAARVFKLALKGKKDEAEKGIGPGSEFKRLSSLLILKLSSLKVK